MPKIQVKDIFRQYVKGKCTIGISLIVIAIFFLSAFNSRATLALSLQEQINSFQLQNQHSAEDAAALDMEADDLESTIASLQAQIDSLDEHIRELEKQRDKLQTKILAAEVELERQQTILGENIRAMYLESDMSTMEMLVTSKDLGDYLDREQYRTTVRDAIKQTLDTISALKQQLVDQKAEQERLLAEVQAAQNQLAVQRNEQQRLLNLNQAEQAELNASIKSNSVRISQLREQQAAENARFISGNGGSIRRVTDGTGYPWANVQPFPNSFSDPWGMYKRQCVSYTAWRVHNDGKRMPYWGGRGNAKNWPTNARNAGIPVSSTPRKGDVAISTRGTYGHAMYVEEVLSNGMIRISQYNASWDGRYSEATISPAGLQFIHF